MTTLEERVASMPRLVPFRLAIVCALALISTLPFAASALAKGPVADLRVVGKGGKVLDEDSFGVAGTVSVKPSPKATCFGPGTGGSGKKMTLKGNSALGMLVRAAQFTAALKPVLLTDHFVDEFGLGICSVGGTKATSKSSWFLKLNHKARVVGGESVKVRGGDEVLWAYGGYPYPDDLALSAPAEVQANVPFTVQVFAYDEKGKKAAASGATVSGASGPTDQSGHATVTLAAPALLSARLGKDIPSAAEPVCVNGKCPTASE
jgi:hypothetical protein